MSESMTKHYQEVIADLVAERGYRDGYTDAEFAARQALKMAEEVAELLHALGPAIPAEVRMLADELGEAARRWFDSGFPRGYFFHAPRREDWENAVMEGGDVFDTLACFAEGAGDHLGERIDIVQVAVAKARADVARGKRGA